MTSTHSINLNGTWRLGRVRQQPLSFRVDDRAAVDEWLPATVPGNVHADLMRAGRLPDLYLADHIRQAGWVDEWDWWLEREVELLLEAGERAFVQFDGIDYVGTIWLDDELLACHEGAFSGHTIEVSKFLKEKEKQTAPSSPSFRLAVRLWGANVWPMPDWRWWERLLAPLTRLILPGKASLRPFHRRLRLLRAPMQAGWDFAPALAALGLWEGVKIQLTGAVRIAKMALSDWIIQPSGQADATLTLWLDVAEATRANLHVAWRPYNVEGVGGEVTTARDLTVGENKVDVPLTIRDAQRWHPWEQGEPNLYELTVSVQIADRSSAISTLRVGIRTVEWDQMRLRVNEQPLFARGVNWVPCDILLGTVARARYEQLLTMARDRGVNFVRVWGGGGRERREFYEICDELGLLVWQEFPFACAFLDHYPRDDTFMGVVEQEATAIVRQLRHHPSLVLWCAGNEFSYLRNRPLVNKLAQIVANEDTRFFLRPSPGQHDRHNWHVWHGKGSLEQYTKETSAFLSEFGLQAPPNRTSLERFLPPESLWPSNELWELHHADMDKLQPYATGSNDFSHSSWGERLMSSLLPYATRRNDFSHSSWAESFIADSQAAQAQGVQLAVERMRRRKASGAGGVAIWQWNEPWPAISWALVDYYGTPKLAAERLRDWYHPLLLSLEFSLPLPLSDAKKKQERVLRAALWAMNDLAKPITDCGARVIQHDQCLWSISLDLPPHSARHISDMTITLPDPTAPLRLELWQGDKLLTTNQYELSRLGPSHSSYFLKLHRTVAEWIMRY